MMMASFKMKVDGKEYDLSDFTNLKIDVHEYAEIEILVVHSVDEHLTIIVGDYSLPMYKSGIGEAGYSYTTKVLKLFRNFIGITHVELYSDNNLIFESIAVNVLASKVNYNRALCFLKSLSNETDISSICFSPTKIGSDYTPSKNNISAKISLGLKALDYFFINRAKFKNDPCISKKITSSIRNFSKTSPIDDSLIAEICSNPAALIESDYSQADIRVLGKYYQIGDVNLPLLEKNTDTFENRVLLAFFYDYFHFLSKAKKLYVEMSKGASTVSIDGVDYVSIDKILRDSGLLMDTYGKKIEYAIDRTKHSINFLKQYLPCESGNGLPLIPNPTHQVLSKPHYFKLFHAIKSYNTVGEPTWRGSIELLGLRNMSKIYEFTALTKLLKSLQTLEFDLICADYLSGGYVNATSSVRPVNEPNNYYVFENSNNVKVEIFYDFKTELVKNKSLIGSLGIPVDMTHEVNQTWRPDFFFRVKNDNGVGCHIFDAKYSNKKEVERFHLQECGFKYGMKTSVTDLDRLKAVQSVTIFYSERSEAFQSIFRNIDLASRCFSSSGFVLDSPVLGMVGVDENDNIHLVNFIKSILIG